MLILIKNTRLIDQNIIAKRSKVLTQLASNLVLLSIGTIKANQHPRQ